MKNLSIVLFIFLCFTCSSDDEGVFDGSTIESLDEYVEFNSDSELDEVIACAGGLDSGLFLDAPGTTSVIYYPIAGATEIRYFESETLLDSLDFSAYRSKDVQNSNLFNGFLAYFTPDSFEGERMAIVTFKTEGKLHISNPIRLKTNVKPTEINNDLLNLKVGGVNPSFSWQDGIIDETAIYFQVISDANDNFISGTYTFDKNFRFYELDNVVLNITQTTNPVLLPNEDYQFTLMGVSEDNWVNLLIKQEFQTR